MAVEQRSFGDRGLFLGVFVRRRGWLGDSGMDAEVLAQLLAFVEQTADFVGVSDPWGRIQYLNPAALEAPRCR